MCTKVFADKKQTDADRAIALCWIVHLVADGHQPCHAGSLYAPVFRDGDRGANSIRLVGGGNLHAAWDKFLGDRASANDVRRRVVELSDIRKEQTDEVGKNWPRPATWLAESADLGRKHVYTPEVIEPVTAASRGLTKGVPELKLADAYFENADAVARQQAKHAGLRLSRVLSACLRIAGR